MDYLKAGARLLDHYLNVALVLLLVVLVAIFLIRTVDDAQDKHTIMRPAAQVVTNDKGSEQHCGQLEAALYYAELCAPPVWDTLNVQVLNCPEDWRPRLVASTPASPAHAKQLRVLFEQQLIDNGCRPGPDGKKHIKEDPAEEAAPAPNALSNLKAKSLNVQPE